MMMMMVVETVGAVMVSQGHKRGSLTCDFSPISPTCQVLIDSINRGGVESPDAGAFRVKSAYVMTCSPAG